MQYDDYADLDLDYESKAYYCTHCKEDCVVRWEDDGIGAYDYHGAKGVDKKWIAYSECCDAAVTDEAPQEDGE